ncbi:CopG family transcriptional regulator [Saccharolobus solfataricus]|uniref:CopG family transcriptional regulator n=1 Tax=Saccharolobus solfataricus TaxID=2287 RepID=A0A157SZB2_SACSO|nr:CopG family transcriptional regulator [Saccharolobus solfataricus]
MVRVITFKAEEELLIKLDLFALNNRMSRSEVIRMAIEKYLEEAAGGIRTRDRRLSRQ